MGTRQRIHGSDTPFTDWFRKQTELDADDIGVVLNDVDVLIHRYKVETRGYIEKGIQAIMQVEVKTLGWQPKKNDSQLDTFWKLNEFRGSRVVKGAQGLFECVTHFGVFILHMDNTSPDNSSKLTWMSFVESDEKSWHLKQSEITREQLIGLSRFEINPFTLEPMAFGSWVIEW